MRRDGDFMRTCEDMMDAMTSINIFFFAFDFFCFLFLVSVSVSAILVHVSLSVFVLLFYRAPEAPIFQQILPARAFDRKADFVSMPWRWRGSCNC